MDKKIELIKKIEKEGDYFTFEYNGFKCEIKRITSFMHLCGYVISGDNFPIDLEKYGFTLDISCHGGITYNEAGIIGFDTAHYGDFLPLYLYQPYSPYEYAINNYGYYRDMEYCIGECKSIVNQLIEMIKGE